MPILEVAVREWKSQYYAKTGSCNITPCQEAVISRQIRKCALYTKTVSCNITPKLGVTLSDNDEYLLWGWERFFTELSTFLHTAERQRETANEAYSEYVLQRLQTSLLSLSALMDHLRTGVHVNNQQAVVCAHYILH